MRVYFLPGLFGSELQFKRFGVTSTLWINPALIFLNGFGAFSLAPDGGSPGEHGRELFPGGPLPDVYTDALVMLQQQLPASQYTVVPFGYDWRKDILSAGIRLAADISANCTAQDPCVLIGHSQGGLVARVAWQLLGLAGGHPLLKRIITLGTPHWGSYAAPMIFSGGYDEFGWIEVINHILYALSITPGVPPILPPRLSADEVIAIMATWPAIYQLFPSLHAPEAPQDPDRQKLYISLLWPLQRGVSGDWLAYALRFQDYLAGADTVPPPGRLTCIAGEGYSAVWKMNGAQTLMDNSGWESTFSGDGTVTRASAILPQSVSFRVKSDHRFITSQVAASGLLAKEVMADRPDNLTPPPTADTPAPLGWFPLFPDFGSLAPLAPLREFCAKGTRIR